MAISAFGHARKGFVSFSGAAFLLGLAITGCGPGAGSPDAAAPAGHWDEPLSRSAYLTGVWGASADDVWAVGADGVALHWNGTRWSDVSTGTEESLLGVWGSSSDSVWAVGENGVALRWNGEEWLETNTGTSASLQNVWGSGPEEVWATGGPAVVKWDGTEWRRIEIPGSQAGFHRDVWGSGPNDVWIVGQAAERAHWDGGEWSVDANPEGDALASV